MPGAAADKPEAPRRAEISASLIYLWRQARREAAGVLRAAADGVRRAAGALTGSDATAVDLAVGGRATIAF